jgi:hypothetical protein
MVVNAKYLLETAAIPKAYLQDRAADKYLLEQVTPRTSGAGAYSKGGYMECIAGNGAATATATGYSHGGIANLLAGSSDIGKKSYGGKTKVYGGLASNAGYLAYGGSVRIVAGAAIGGAGSSGGTVYIYGGDTVGVGAGGNLIIKAGASTGGAHGQVKLPTIPNSDPGISGSIWFDSVTNVLMRSP